MTDINGAKKAVLDRFVSQWGTTSPATFDNEVFKPVTGVSWIRVVVRNIEANQETLGAPGNRKFEREALLIAQIFTPPNEGTASSDALAESFRAIFEGESFSEIHFEAVTVRESGPEPNWYKVVAEAPFTYNELK